VLEEAPQRHHQLARQGKDGNASDATLLIADALLASAAQRTARLVASPQPGQLDRRRTGLADCRPC
jgi:hypothetical protein